MSLTIKHALIQTCLVVLAKKLYVAQLYSLSLNSCGDQERTLGFDYIYAAFKN